MRPSQPRQPDQNSQSVRDDAIQITLAPGVGLVQAYSAAAVVPFNFVKTAAEKALNRLRTANYFDGKCPCVLFPVLPR